MEYKLIYSKRKTLAVEIKGDGSVIVRAPAGCSKNTIRSFLSEKEEWINQKSLEQKSKNNSCYEDSFTDVQRSGYIRQARDIFHQRADYYGGIMGVSYNRVFIREQKTRWGSCSLKQNLNFNWRLIFAPNKVLDYVVIHELAHLKEMNHSKQFYRIIEEVMPDYKVHKKWLRDNGYMLGKVKA